MRCPRLRGVASWTEFVNHSTWGRSQSSQYSGLTSSAQVAALVAPAGARIRGGFVPSLRSCASTEVAFIGLSSVLRVLVRVRLGAWVFRVLGLVGVHVNFGHSTLSRLTRLIMRGNRGD